MCGIVGAVRFSGARPGAAALAEAVASLANRGPDDAGTWLDDHAALGHRRLAVLDLSVAGHQPMVSSDGRYVIVFNGEIYNHLDVRHELGGAGGWRGTSDTETILEAFRTWGPDCLRRFNGMFAFAIWDRRERSLFLARDRIGEKPLYYRSLPAGVDFGSRPTALRRLVGGSLGELDPTAMQAYVDLGYIPSPLSAWSSVSKLPPAHYLVVDGRGSRLVRYWDFRHIAPEPGWERRPEADLVDELEGLLFSAVRHRLLSDVPVGAFLSGGTDSALILAAISRCGATATAFTIGFKERSHDESDAAREIAQRLGVVHVTEQLGVSSLLTLLPQCVTACDEPLADSSVFPTMAVAKLARPRVTVALTGDAGDELFGGYHYYRLIERLARLGRISRQARGSLARIADWLPAHRAKLFAEAIRRNSGVRQFHFVRSMRKDFPSVLLPGSATALTGSGALFEASAASFALDLEPAEIGMRLDTSFMLADGYLQKVDVATMAFSLEARCVLTDHRIVEWAMRLPVAFKLRGATSKYLLKELLRRYLPERLVSRPKRGFGMPVAAWLRGPLRDWAAAILHEDSLFIGTPIDRVALRRLFALHGSGRRDAHPLLWSSLMLLCFIAHHERGLSLPDFPGVREAA